jgi:hypothetical protein
MREHDGARDRLLGERQQSRAGAARNS